ncbi:MAG: HAD family hydrolase [Alphaproteobacteria bacterium]|jgi:HAD superfamily hydrolase (TIGR01493 family)|nr:HAD family hydrolase [Alphaproteobacteria bacterium]MBU1278047.1 HAD family hydrolase [Alphaproteobacteria bacterium]MBU1572034.1 HAD family hydrolase [Alphaproteobacteria bacterium]MBU1828356.1 HAD family hydrolase [Alphaproteobacteria bacterium]MBU2078155.1 HAD family hydrolase [Alphaproteobacteria bacterium]
MNETEVHQQVLERIELICFDLFGTLVEITDRRRPFASLRRNMALDKVARMRRLAMTTDLALEEIDEAIQGGATVDKIVGAKADIAREVASTRLRTGVPEMLSALPVPFGICSNLSPDYLPALQRFAEVRPAFRIMSCEVGYLKPDPEIYELVVAAAGVPREKILFVGDTPSADIDGPRCAGMQANHVDQFLSAWL